jgi:hypothetical protein
MSATTGSTGLVSSTIVSDAYDTTKTAVLLSTGTLKITTTTGTGALVVSAGAAITDATTVGDITADQTCVVMDTTEVATIKPTGAIGSTFTVSTYSEDTCATAATLSERVTVTIAGSDLSGTAVVANTRVRWTADNTASTGVEDTTKAATTTGNALYMYVQVRDAYTADVSSTSGALVVTASAGANVIIGAGSITTFGTTGTAVSAADPSPLYIAVTEATAGAGWSGTVTVSYNGVVMATKTGKITGTPSKLTIAALKVGKNDGNANAAALSYQVTDAAGNNIVVPFADIVYSSSTVTALVSAAAGSVVNTTDTVGNATFTCANSAAAVGTTDLVMQTTLASGTIIKSNALSVRCGGGAAKYTASWDKATYAQGDIAILTVSFTDLVGSPANSYDAVSADTNQVLTALQMERVTAHSAAATPGSSSTIAYTFTVGTASGAVAGAYQAVISYPTVNTAGSSIKTGNIAAGYSVTAPASVSNADVLKSIVALIASINKQIQALQKLILKR